MTISQPEKDTSATLLPVAQPLTQPTSMRATQNVAESFDDEHSSSSSSNQSDSLTMSGNENGENKQSSEATINDGALNSSSSYSFGSSFEEDILCIFGPECSYVPTPSSMKTYKLTGDNLDKNVKPTEYRIDSQTRSLHYFQTYMLFRIGFISLHMTTPHLHLTSPASIQ